MINDETIKPKITATTAKPKTRNKKEEQLCRFFLKGKCRAGDLCRFQHARPDSTLVSARDREISDLTAAFPSTSNSDTPTCLHLSFVPSDPDFPFPLDNVHLSLTVPLTYPPANVTLQALNPELPPHLTEFCTQAVAHRIKQPPVLSLVQLVKWFDSNLESILKGAFVAPKSTLVFIRPTAALVHQKQQLQEPPITAQKQGVVRDSHLNAIRRRFRSSWAHISQTEFQFEFMPTDPDWESLINQPGGLGISVTVPQTYPNQAAQWKIVNSQFSDDLTTCITNTFSQPSTSLLSAVNHLDRHLVSIVRSFLDSDKLIYHREEDDQEESIVTMPNSTNPNEPPKSGSTQIKVPDIQLINVSFLECTLLSVLLSCVRCKHASEFNHIPPTRTADPTAASPNQPCAQCRAPLNVYWSARIMYINHPVIGYASTLNATVSDVLPSLFSATCELCMGITVLRKVGIGTPVKSNCRTCHAGMSMCLTSVAFLRLGSGGVIHGGAPVRQQQKEPSFQLIAGQPLPKNGTCSHYQKSCRWFRFPCCGRVYPCDKCHELGKADMHDMVRSSRAICGFCSKEQQITSLSACQFCRASLTANKSGSGFWEAGLGTRNTLRMANKDSRKHAGLNKTKSNKAERVGVAGSVKANSTKKWQQE